MSDPRARGIRWERGPNAEWAMEAEVEGQRWRIRIGDFPAEPMYTLVVDGEDALAFDEWPPTWQRPRLW